MARHVVVLVLFMLGIGVLCATQAPTEAKHAPAVRGRKRAPAVKAQAKAAKVAAPGPVDGKSLGFGSTRADVERLMGKPTRVAKVAKREVWFYGLSSISLANGQKVIAWSKYDRTLPVNIGSAKPGAKYVHHGSTMAELVAAYGTPTTVAIQGQYQVWFFDTQRYAVRNGKVVPEQVDVAAAKTTPKPAPKGTPAPRQQAQQAGCWCPL